MHWLQRRRAEFFYRRAKEQKYRARSAYKLLEIQRKFRIIKRGDSVLDLGAAPGSWCQVALQIVGKSGRVLAVDILPVASLEGVFEFIQADFTSKSFQSKLKGKKFDVILSDAAPEFSGVKELDFGRTLELNKSTISLAKKFLKENGNLLFKSFQKPELRALLSELKKFFKFVKLFKPSASLKSSPEIYIICKKFTKKEKI